MNVILGFRDFLRTKLTDPANRGDNWIFDNFPRSELADKPVISLLGAEKVSNPFSLGNTAWKGQTMVQIDVWVRDDIGYTIGETAYYDKDLCIYLADMVEFVTRKYWIEMGIMLIDLTGRTPLVYDKEKVSWRITLTYDVRALEDW